MTQDGELQMYQVVRMNLLAGLQFQDLAASRRGSRVRMAHPILRRLSDKRALITARTGITLHRVPTSAHEIIEFRKLDDEGVPIVLVERSLIQVVLDKRRLESKVGHFLMMMSIQIFGEETLRNMIQITYIMFLWTDGCVVITGTHG